MTAVDRDRRLIAGAAFLRSVSIGLVGVVLGIYLARLGLSPVRIGIVIAVGLAGGAVATLVVSLWGDRMGRRRTLTLLVLLSAAGYLALVMALEFHSLLAAAFLGTLNGMGRDRGAAFALEQAILPGGVAASRRTWVLAWYNVTLDAGHAVGSVLGAIPALLRSHAGIETLASYRAALGLCTLLSVASAVVYQTLSHHIELAHAAAGSPGSPVAVRVSSMSKGIIARLAALSALDSLGGGFLGSALVAYWFFRRYGISERELGPLFFAARVLNAASYVGAASLARRIGLVRTMVATHLPSSLLLMLVPVVPSFGWSVAFFLARESLVEMDVPTRQSYVAAVVAPHERTVASGVTNLTRNVSWAVGPGLAGFVMQNVALASPLFVGGLFKIAYDLLLFGAFRQIKPPEEHPAPTPSPTTAHP